MVNKKIREARNKLADIYNKYSNELHKVVKDIDKMLEALEDAPN